MSHYQHDDWKNVDYSDEGAEAHGKGCLWMIVGFVVWAVLSAAGTVGFAVGLLIFLVTIVGAGDLEDRYTNKPR